MNKAGLTGAPAASRTRSVARDHARVSLIQQTSLGDLATQRRNGNWRKPPRITSSDARFPDPGRGNPRTGPTSSPAIPDAGIRTTDCSLPEKRRPKSTQSRRSAPGSMPGSLPRPRHLGHGALLRLLDTLRHPVLLTPATTTSAAAHPLGAPCDHCAASSAVKTGRSRFRTLRVVVRRGTTGGAPADALRTRPGHRAAALVQPCEVAR